MLFGYRFKMFTGLAMNLIFSGFLICAITCLETAESSNVKEVESSNNTAISEKKPSYSISFLPDYELTWKNGFEQVLAVSVVIISSFVILGGLAWLLAPLFGYRLCTLLDNCEATAFTQPNGGNLQDPGHGIGYPDLYNSVVSPYMSTYRKRSIKYVGPLLKTLASAYEKFDQQTASPLKTE